MSDLVVAMPVPQSVVEDSSSQQQSTSWADRMEDLEASKITPGLPNRNKKSTVLVSSQALLCIYIYIFCVVCAISVDNLPEPVTTIEGDKKTIVSYKLDEGKIKKVSPTLNFSIHGCYYSPLPY